MKNVKGTRQTFSAYYLEGKIIDVIEKLKSALEDVPEEYRDSASLEADADIEYSSPYCYFEVTYRRPETEKEKEERELQEHDRLALQTNRERAQYEKLKKKFEQS